MGGNEQIDLLSEVGNIILDLGGFADNDFLLAGVTQHELLNPTHETLARLREYHTEKYADITSFRM